MRVYLGEAIRCLVAITFISVMLGAPALLAYLLATSLGAESQSAGGIAVPVFFLSLITECFGFLSFIERKLRKA